MHTCSITYQQLVVVLSCLKQSDVPLKQKKKKTFALQQHARFAHIYVYK